ncbi:MAG: hypothetical protein JWN56_1434 [Sphingobacteriales bacterium]|nr:hypothetical protein [Sphingobacteriales bacterium]
MSPVSLQINLAPGDYLHARYILPHQLKILTPQVDEIILTVDTKPSRGRFSIGWNENKELLYNFLQNEIQPKYNVKIIPVDYSKEMQIGIAGYFFGNNQLPEKDFRGGPFYAYFFGLHSAANNLIFHLDSDMFLGGGSETWITEAIQLFESDPKCLIISPLPGPPDANEHLINQTVKNKIGSYIYELDGMSTRIFMIDKSILKKKKLTFNRPSFRNQIKAIIQRNPNADLPEHILSSYINKQNLKRIDFLGRGNGLWSLHPPFRTKTFYNDLPSLIARVENNDLPKKQNGFYDIIDDVCDWNEARVKLKNNIWWKKLL